MTAEELHARVAARIREACTRHRLRVTELADRAGVSRGYLFDVLRGKKSPTVAYLFKLATALDIDPVTFLKPYRGKPPAPSLED